MKKIIFNLLIISFLVSCQKEKISISPNANDTFFVENKGQSMKVDVRGNTVSKTMVLFVHGGPGQGSDLYKASTEVQSIVEKKYGVAYWDQRLVYTSQGSAEGAITLATFGDLWISINNFLIKRKYVQKSVSVCSKAIYSSIFGA